MKPKIKPRNPFVALAKFRKAGSHDKPEKSLRRQEKQALAKTAKQLPESWHQRIASQCAGAMAEVGFLLSGILHTTAYRPERLLSSPTYSHNRPKVVFRLSPERPDGQPLIFKFRFHKPAVVLLQHPGTNGRSPALLFRHSCGRSAQKSAG